MPELPEVQTIVNDLQNIVGDQFTGFFSDFPKAINIRDFGKELIAKKVVSVKRLGKIILIELNDKKNIAIHLKMTGKLLLNFRFLISNFKSNPNAKISKQTAIKILDENKHIHHLFLLKKSGMLAFSDVRKFATISLLNEKDIEKIKNNYGTDPIDDAFSVSDLAKVLEKRKNKPIKSILMDNSVILGIGNIYASEILFDAKILPMRLGNSLSKKEIEKLHSSILRILTRAIKMRGTSVSDYRDSQGLKGFFQDELKVYRKHGQKCNICDTIIEKVILGQRSTFFCPRCQK